MKITIEMLDEKDACYDGMMWFMKRFGVEADHTEIIRQLEKEKATEDWMDWLIERFKLSGRAQQWWENGKKKWNCPYKNGKPHGRCQEWLDDGTKFNDYILKKGKIIKDNMGVSENI